MKTHIIYILSIIILIAVSVFSISKCSGISKEKKQAQNSADALFESSKKLGDSITIVWEKLYRSDSLSAIAVQKLQISNKAILASKMESVDELYKAGIKLSELTSIGDISAKLRVSLDSTKLRYTQLIDRIKRDTVNCATFSDKYITISACMDKSKISGINAYGSVPLFWGVQEQRKKIWFITLPKWLFGIKQTRFVITTSSPYVELTGAEYIEKK